MRKFFKKLNPGRKPALICLASGLAAAFAFPPFGFWFVAPVAMLPLWYMAAQRPAAQALAAGWLWGIGLYLGTMYWLTYVMVGYGGLPMPLAALVFILLCLYLGAYVGVCLWLCARLHALRLPMWLSAPLMWAGLEFLRGLLLTGFPWLPLSLSLTDYPSLVQGADLIGASGLSLILVFISVLAAYALGLIKALDPPRRLHFVFVLCAVLFLGYIWGNQIRLPRLEREMAKAPQALVSVVQGNIPLNQLWRRDMREHNVMRQLSLSEQASGQAQTRPWLLLWSESAAPFIFLQDVEHTMPILRAAASLRAYVALGSTGLINYEGETRYTNRVYLVSPEGQPLDHYDKVHLVPFGEYVPLAKLLFFVRAVAALSVDMAPGQAGKTLAAGDIVMGPLICYESIFANLARSHKLAGANLLVNPTNDAWFGPTGASSQHLAHLVLRAVENRTAAARPANTGISCFILPSGQVIERTELFSEAVATATLPLLSWETVFAKVGDVAGKAGLGSCILGLLATIIYPRMKKKKDDKVEPNAG